MVLRLAQKSDLSKIKDVFEKIITNMNQNNIRIWDDIYPCAFFEDDIDKNELYVLTNDSDILAVFALSKTNTGFSAVKWKNMNGSALYLDRFGVNPVYQKQGIARTVLKEITKIVVQKNIDYLRLFVVDINIPAISLYLKNGFTQAEGIYEEDVGHTVLKEFGFELDVKAVLQQ